jgi:hypothetical protein
MTVFGTAVIKAEDLARTLSARACAKLTRESSDGEWTSVVLEELRKLGKEKHCEVSPDRVNDERAFVLDLVWWKNAELMDIALAVESEWGRNRDVLNDFGKLLVIKAPLKLMVYCTSHHEKESADRRVGIDSYMRKFTNHIAGEQYVLLEFAVPERMVYAYGFSVPADGQLNEVKFEEIFESPIKW